MLAAVALCLHLGQWQQGKAEAKRGAQAALERQAGNGPRALPGRLISDTEALRYAPVTVRGRFEPAGQFLVDNRIYQERAGYHVLTPLRIAGSDVRVLVNRGWIAAPADHRQLPVVTTPTEELSLRGIAVIPGNRFFTLGAVEQGMVRQNLDLPHFIATAPYPVQALVIELDPTSPAGFVRDWPRRDERWEKHLSYALQWYGFAATAVAIWAYVSWRGARRTA